VVISGRNGRRGIHGALHAHSGELVDLVRERSRQDDCIAFLERLGQVRPDVPTLLIWDNAPPHHPRRVLAAAAAAPITIAWLPFRSPALNPLEDLWRLLKRMAAANRVYDTLDALATHAVTWLDAHLPDQLLACCGLRSSKFDWLPT
jgi:transposase